MAQLFEDESCVRWWLPNDEGFSPLLQNIRAIADERNALAIETQKESLQRIGLNLARMQIGTDHGATEDGDGALGGAKGKQPAA
jgi:hypothetical protein